MWWAVLHVIALAGAATLPLPLVLGAAVLAHAWLRRPRKAPAELRSMGECWAVPAIGVHGARLGPRTRYTRAWVRLELLDPGRRQPTTLLLLRDQLDAEDWRVLQTRLRRGRDVQLDDGARDFR